MGNHDELICAFLLSGDKPGRELSWQEVQDWTPDQGNIWVHFDCTHPGTGDWLRAESSIAPYVLEGLLADETRPRCDSYDEGALIILRGVNLNPDARPEDMVSIRVWADSSRVITTRLRRLMAVDDIRNQMPTGKGPATPGQFLAKLAGRLIDRMGPVIDTLSDQTSELEEALIGSEEESNLEDMRHKLNELRRVAIALRRYISPQKEALRRLNHLDEDWMEEEVQGPMLEVVDRITRINEELEEIRERASVIQDELANRLAQRMGGTMYLLTLVATIIMPLSFVTGLLGINVGGIPGSENPWAFAIVCAMMAAVGIGMFMLFKKMKWLTIPK
ncbi:zinc transporter [Aestuariispira insulae]|uniref:Zinc transporter n=2 Tax=Aestuariispira insulae TaxID=1461337 RepID=A0A3D9H3X9_9PROT|nr:zinc transporter [Aestuariispira insulae]